MDKTGMIIIGAGIVGASIAYYLSKWGIPITLIDRGKPGCGTSGSSMSYINAVLKRPEHYHKLSRLGVEEYNALEEELGPNTGLGNRGAFHWPGSMVGDLETFYQTVEELERMDYPHEILSHKQVASIEPNVRVDSYDGPVLYLPFERWAEGDILSRRLSQGASSAGAKIIESCTVGEIIIDGNRTLGVTTSHGFIPGNLVVIAAGTASVGLLGPLRHRLNLNRVVGILCISSKVGNIISSVLYPGSYHCRPTHDGRILFGSDEFDAMVDEDTDTSKPPLWTNKLLQLAKKDIDGIENVVIEEIRIAPRPMPGDGLPIIGSLPNLPGVYVAVMHSGITLAPIVGKTVANEIITGDISTILEPYRPDRPSLQISA